MNRLSSTRTGGRRGDERRAAMCALTPTPGIRGDRCGGYTPLMASESVRLVGGDFSTGGGGERSGTEMAGSMRLGESREKSVIMVRQSSKLQAVTADRLWTVHDVSAFLGVPVGTLYQWRYMRIGPPAYRVGRHIRYDPAAVRTWLDTQDAYGR
jgi:predicted DNA-binding transcriptional regulator AlpA